MMMMMMMMMIILTKFDRKFYQTVTVVKQCYTDHPSSGEKAHDSSVDSVYT